MPTGRQHVAADLLLPTPTPGPSTGVGGLLSCIPRGRRDATSIRALMDATGLSDRAVREELHRLICEDRVPIVTLPCRNGVWIAETPAELAQARAHLVSKLLSLRERMDALERCAEDMSWRPTLFEVAL